MRARYDWGYTWPTELDALCDPSLRDWITARGLELSSYADLGGDRKATAGGRMEPMSVTCSTPTVHAGPRARAPHHAAMAKRAPRRARANGTARWPVSWISGAATDCSHCAWPSSRPGSGCSASTSIRRSSGSPARRPGARRRRTASVRGDRSTMDTTGSGIRRRHARRRPLPAAGAEVAAHHRRGGRGLSVPEADSS